MKIPTKYLLFVLVPLVIFTAILGAGLYLRSSNALKIETDRHILSIVKEVKALLVEDANAVKSDLTTILINKALEEYFMLIDLNEINYLKNAKLTLEEDFIKVAKAKPHYASLKVFDSDKNLIVGVTDKRITRESLPIEKKWIKLNLNLKEGDFYISKTFNCPEHKIPSFAILKPYYYREKIKAVAIVKIHLQEFFGKLIKDIDVGKSGYIYLVANNGIIAAHKDPSKIGVDINNLKSTKAVIAEKAAVYIEKGENKNSPIMKKAFMPLGIGELGIVVAQPLSEAMAVSNSMKKDIIMIVAIVTIILLLLIYFTSRKIIINPIKQLHNAAEHVAQGDLSTKVVVATNDEIGDLANTFNRMTASLASSLEKEKQLAAATAAAEVEHARATELEKAYKELQETQAMLIQAEKMTAVGELASGIAHEVKNPLGIIIQGVNYFEREIDPKNTQQFEILEMMKEAVLRSDRIIRSLLDFSRPAKLQLKLTDINKIIDESLELVKKQLTLHDVGINKDIDFNLPQVMIDENQMKQVFINLFINAFQAMPNGGELLIKAYTKKEVLICEIKDTGSGIPEEILSKIFNPFFTTKGPKAGTGLGLSITKTIIEGHKGAITVQSKEKQGTTVTLILPASKDKEAV